MKDSAGARKGGRLSPGPAYNSSHPDGLQSHCRNLSDRDLRDAESFQKALSIDPNNVEAMISLGDLYRAQGMISRAQTCYEDVLKISSENQQAKTRLEQLKKKK